MKILAFSDLHRDATAAEHIVAASEQADIVVGAGDFATRGEGTMETLEILRRCRVPVIVVHGNHDVPEILRTVCGAWPGWHYLHGTAVTLSGATFFGLGGEVPPRVDAPWNVAETEGDAATRLDSCPADAILVTHTPPHGTVDGQPDGTHEGSIAIRAAIRSKRPLLNLCGHIHNEWGMTDHIGETLVRNLGPEASWHSLHRPREAALPSNTKWDLTTSDVEGSRYGA